MASFGLIYAATGRVMQERVKRAEYTEQLQA